MSHFDVFNGDADGLCALHQLRLAQPRAAELVSGVKRDNALLARVPAAAGDSMTVLDISMANNREALLKLLEGGVRVEYFDHHRAGDIPAHPCLDAIVDTGPDICTAVLVDRRIGGRHRPWAVVGAFGDAMRDAATALAASLGYDVGSVERLRRLGECLNYNAYGESAADQMYRPEELYRLMQPYPDPLRFLAGEPVYERLARQFDADLALAMAVSPFCAEGTAAVYRLPDAAWARRIVGAFANRLSAAAPKQALAVLVPNSGDRFGVSLRVPAGAAPGADQFAGRYGGNGRLTAAGIDGLPPSAIAGLAQDFLRTFRAS